MTQTAVEETSASLEVANELSELARVGEWVNAWAERHRLSAKNTANLDLCAAEAVTNVITHGYKDGGRHLISLHLSCQDTSVTLEIEDDAPPFDPLQAGTPPQPASLEEAPI